MLERLKRKRAEQTVMGHRLEEPRLTLWAAGEGWLLLRGNFKALPDDDAVVAFSLRAAFALIIVSEMPK